MSKLPELTLTRAGEAMLAKTPIGSEIPVTKWRIGDGQLPDGEDPKDRTQLVNPVRELPIASAENDGNQCLVMGQLVNTEMDAFTWRETGLYATDPDDGEILYAYGYEADGAEIPAGATQLREIEFGVELTFDTAANVTAVISKTLVFARLDDLEQAKADAVAETLKQITTSEETTELADSDAFATVTTAGVKRTPLSLLKTIMGELFPAKVKGATSGNLAVLSDTGEFEDSGKKPSDFAPGGYGLGENINRVINSEDELNDLTQGTGWFFVDIKGFNAVGVETRYGIGLLMHHNTYVEQILYLHHSIGGYLIKAIRYQTNASPQWSAWECENPPTMTGVEFRSTERWNGKPVYQKLIDIGYLPNTSYKIVQYSDDASCRPIRVYGNFGTASIPGTIGTSDNQMVLLGGNSNNIVIKTYGDYSQYSANVCVWYYKTTD